MTVRQFWAEPYRTTRETVISVEDGADLPDETYFTDQTNQRRCWTIAGFAEVSCGGTPVRSTREVGEIQLKRKNVGQGKERIEIRLANADAPTVTPGEAP